jgi:hypothetical protein
MKLLLRGMISLSCIFLALFALSARAQDATCQNDTFTRAAAEVQESRQRLLALPIGNGLDADVSADAQKSILQMKDRLNEFILSYMSCVPTSTSPDPAKIEKDLSTLGHAFALPPGPIDEKDIPSDADNYGYQLSFEVRSTPDARRLVSITADFQIECGSDAMLLIFAPTASGWREVLRWQSKPYNQVSGAFGSFGYAISPPSSNGQWYVIVKNVLPWCSSTWSAIRYAALRPAQDSPLPKVFFSRSHSIWWGNDDVGTVTANVTDFEIRFHAESIDSDVHNRLFIFHFKVTSDGATRLPPLAANPRDFVDEWIVSSWNEAYNWSLASERETLQSAHDQLRTFKNSGHGGFEYDSAFRCSGAPDRFQISLSDLKGHSWYFLVQGKDKFTMSRVGRSIRSSSWRIHRRSQAGRE